MKDVVVDLVPFDETLHLFDVESRYPIFLLHFEHKLKGLLVNLGSF